MAADDDDEVTLLMIPEEPDREIQATIEASTEDGCFSANATCQVEIISGGGSGGGGGGGGGGDGSSNESKWTLRSRDQDGKLKVQGGDEFYVRYEEYIDEKGTDEEVVVTCQAVAILHDNNDGSYTLDFVSTPMYPALPSPTDAEIHSKIHRRLTVYFEYTNGLGRLPPPTKKDWPNGGYTHRRFTKQNFSHRPPIRPFAPPSCTVDLGSFDRILAFGDSTMEQFVRQRPNKKGKYYFHPNVLVGEKVRQGLNSTTVENVLELVEEDFGDMIRQYTTEGKSICLLLGSCLWDILNAGDTLQGMEYEDHIRACRQYIMRIRERYDQVTVAWKSPMAVHIHWVDLQRLIEHDQATATLFGRDRVRYMSSSRSKYIYSRQRKLMQELEVPLLDIYEASYLSADQLFPSDGRHYRPDLNRLMLGWFTPNASGNEKYYQNVPPL